MGNVDIYGLAKQIYNCLIQKGWNSANEFIKKVEQKNNDNSKEVIRQLQTLINNSSNADYIYKFAVNVNGADISSALYKINMIIDEMWNSDCFSPNSEVYKRVVKYKKSLEKLSKSSSRSKSSKQEINRLIDDL